ncbi:DNase I-like protein [Hypoxylon trugodes]|uniref:DNase I-like protein n=1 Tax=Hypoxylon trugodes TaxID=326681 RepID=UPI0021A123A2|nr:DNase I-like protein [Hypoxylon trugodes]KAI1392259.1 DNase I-like protein [Hypoxylon trugodes]
MEPVPTLDVFILTFNAAKRQINIPVFARHIYNAFGQNASTLPELVVISLQEMAPLAQAFIGSYILNPYFQRYESAINLAAAKFAAEEERQHRPKGRPYKLVTTRNVGMTGIMLFARESAAVHNLQVAEVGFGAGDMANKGAAGLRMLYRKENADGTLSTSTELTFVSAHLAAMEWNLDKRNKNWESIVSGLVFEDPKKFTERSSMQTSTLPANEDSEAEVALLEQDSNEKALHEISIYKPSSHLFVCGDLNYRLSKISPASDSTFPDVDPESPNHFARFLARDQLTAEKNAGRTLHGLSEASINFPPTYKLVLSPKAKPQAQLGRIGDDESEENDMDDVEWSWALHRWPGWCDRVLFLDIPWWARESAGGTKMRVTAYDAIPAVRSSDHRAVFLRLEVPMLEPDSLLPTESAYERELSADWHEPVDPRIQLPFPIDFQSWEHRSHVKKWESTIGWSMLISQSKQGIMVLVTVFLIGLGTWWYRSR